MRIGDDHRVFHVFSCGHGHLLARLPTKESVKRQRVVWVEHPDPRGCELLESGAQEPGSPWGRAPSFLLKWLQASRAQATGLGASSHESSLQFYAAAETQGNSFIRDYASSSKILLPFLREARKLLRPGKHREGKELPSSSLHP